MKYKNVKELVEKALKEYPLTRGDDKKLIMTVWWFQDNTYDSHFRKFFQYEAIMPTTIVRARAKFQEKGLYLPEEKIQNIRFQRYVDAKYTSGNSVLF